MGLGFGINMPTSLSSLGDEDLVRCAKQGDRSATERLLSKYRSLVEAKARFYYLAGADHEDVVQEGMIGLFKAIRDFRVDRPAGFRAFAELCVTRQIITAVKSATRHKHLPLNRGLSLQHVAGDSDSGVSLLDVLPDLCVIDPEKELLDADVKKIMCASVRDDLSPLETQVLACYVEGLSYREMAAKLSCRTKSVDNALQRAKRKIGERIARG